MPPEGEALNRVLEPESLPVEGEDFRAASSFVLEARISPVEGPVEDEKGVFRLKGALRGTIELDCVRCLEPFTMALEEGLDLIYLPQSRNVASETAQRPQGATEREESESELVEKGLEPEELAAGFYRDGRIDLGQMIREQIILALPMKPLCREDCRGLCPSCGANRNSTECDCAPDETDPRWSSLKSLLG